MANNYNPYNNTNYYAQKMQNLQGIREQTDKQIQELQNMLQMQQQMQQVYPQQPQIQQTFQLSNPSNTNGDFDARYVENGDEVKNILTYRNSLFINKDMSKLWFKDANGNTKIYELNEIIEKDPKDEEINELKQQIQQLTFIVSQQQNSNQTQIKEDTIVEIPKNQTIGKIEPVKKVVERKGK